MLNVAPGGCGAGVGASVGGGVGVGVGGSWSVVGRIVEECFL